MPSSFKFCDLVMCNLYTKFVKFLEIRKQFSEDLLHFDFEST